MIDFPGHPLGAESSRRAFLYKRRPKDLSWRKWQLGTVPVCARQAIDQDQTMGIRMKRTALLATFLAMASTTALADPGHGLFGSLHHLLSEPDHLTMLALLVGAGVYTFRAFRRMKARR